MLQSVTPFGLPVILGITCEWDEQDPQRLTIRQGMGRPVAAFDEVVSELTRRVEPDNLILSKLKTD